MQDLVYGLPKVLFTKLFGKSRGWRLGRTFRRRAAAKQASLSFLSTHGGASMGAIWNFQSVSLGSSVNKCERRKGRRGTSNPEQLAMDHHVTLIGRAFIN
jgi:hypothetical protein